MYYIIVHSDHDYFACSVSIVKLSSSSGVSLRFWTALVFDLWAGLLTIFLYVCLAVDAHFLN